MSKPRVFVTHPITQSALDRLKAVADVEMNPNSSKPLTKEGIIAGVRKADVLFALLHDKIDRDVVVANPNLKGINTMAVNTTYIDVTEASARKIPVTIIPHIVVIATADQCMALILATARRTVTGHSLILSGVYPGGQSNYLLGTGVTGKVLALVGGAGRIAKEVAKRARGFEMKIIYWDPMRLPEAEERELGMTYVTFDQLFTDGDFVSVHTPLLPETRHQVGERELSLMKPTAYLINTSRGPIVDERALVRALQDKKIGGAGLDVFEFEPNVSPEFLKMNNVVLTPHLGSAVFELRDQMANLVTDNVIAVIEGRVPPNCVNPEIYKK